MNAELWAVIRRLKEVEGLSQRQIAKRLAVHRKTVWRALRCVDAPPKRQKPAPMPSKIEPFKAYLQSRIKDYPELTAAKLLGEIRRQGYGGGRTVLTDYLSRIRPRKTPEVFLRIETLPGEFAQVDWANAGSVLVGTTLRRLSCFVMVLGYSRLMYLEFTLSQCLEDFMQCHHNAFNFFGGIPKRCLYDNLKSVCLWRSGSLIQLNSRFMEFAGVMGFEPVLCNVARGNEKGKVESGIKYVRGNFLAGRPFLPWPGIQEEAQGWRDEVANQRIHGTTRERPALRFERERPCLRPMPEKPFDCCVVKAAKATSQALVHFDGNRYSVPYSHAYKLLTLKAVQGEVKIWEGAKLLAAHPRSYERGVVVENPRHYEGLLAFKKQALAARTQQAFLQLGPEAARYLEGLIETDLNISHHLSKIMEMAHLYGKAEVIAALQEALRYGAWGAAVIQNIIYQRRAARSQEAPEPLELTRKPEWARLSVEQQDLSLYDELFDLEEGSGRG